MIIPQALENASSLSRKGGGNFHGIVRTLRFGFLFHFFEPELPHLQKCRQYYLFHRIEMKIK